MWLLSYSRNDQNIAELFIYVHQGNYVSVYYTYIFIKQFHNNKMNYHKFM
jgi:hypothetical protein